MDVFALARRAALLLAVAALVAGCATPQESGPVDTHEDADRDGVPDGRSPDPWGNKTGNATTGGQNVTGLPPP